MYSPRVSIPSLQGTYTRILSVDEPCSHIHTKYTVNRFNVSLLCVSWTSLLADSPLGLKPCDVIHKFSINLENDVFATVAKFADLAHALTKSLKHVEGGVIIEPFLPEMKDTPVFREYLTFTRTQDPILLQYLLSFLLFGKKLHFVDKSLNAAALRDWLAVEDRLGKLILPDSVVNLRAVMRWIFTSWQFDSFLPSHGGGAVAEPGVRGVNAKCALLPCVDKIDRTYFSDPYLSNDVGDYSLPRGILYSDEESRESSRLKFVPKDWRKTRSICMEPITYQWAQQGVRLEYELNLKDCVLANHVNINDQSINQEASLYGSKTGFIDTLDLSAASDCVSWSLVKAIFPPKVLKHLLATRTSVVQLPTGREVKVSKFAPMGSALCFPVQSTIYSSIVLMVSMARTLGRDWQTPGIFEGVDLDRLYESTFTSTYTDSLPKKYLPFHCYGDDITCDKRVSSSVIECLVSVGFVVNEGKSYRGNEAFRESCGTFHFNGIDVTPLILKTKQINQRISMDSMVGVIEMANRSYDYGYSFLRKTLVEFCMYFPIDGIEYTKRMTINPIPFTRVDDVETSCAIRCTNPRNTHLRLRRFYWDRPANTSTSSRFQRDEVLRVVPGPWCTMKVSKEFDNYWYTTWWRSRYRRTGGVRKDYVPDAMGFLDPASAPSKTDALGKGVKWEWIPA